MTARRRCAMPMATSAVLDIGMAVEAAPNIS
jgi:hypothetical protein